ALGADHMNALHIRHLYHRYGLSEVLADVGLDLYAGETLALVGPSGCGKSTLLQIIGGLLAPSEIVMQCDFRGIGYVFQDPSLMPWMTAQENIALGLKALGVPRAARHRQATSMAARSEERRVGKEQGRGGSRHEDKLM